MYYLLLKANPGDSVTLTNTGLAGHIFDFNNTSTYSPYWAVGLNLVSVTAGYCALRTRNIAALNCSFTIASGTQGIFAAAYCHARNCSFTAATGGCALYNWGYGIDAENCTFNLPTGVGIENYYDGYTQMRASNCTFACQYPFQWYQNINRFNCVARSNIQVAHCVFYNCTNVVQWSGTIAQGVTGVGIEFRNNIVHTATYLHYFTHSPYEWVNLSGSDFNCYYNVTNYDNTRNTLAGWQAATDRYGLSPDVHSFEADPLFTTPGTDFTLLPTSPCRHAGSGAGVPSDITGAPFDPHRPDMGAYSTGLWPGQG
jgi:hypothetical protein